jgi:hypothetical protein
MRRFWVLLAALAVVVIITGTVSFSSDVPYPVQRRPTATPYPTPLPEGFTLIPEFVPAYPCHLQIVNVYSRDLCRSESVTETLLSTANGNSLIEYRYSYSAGCWHEINYDKRELRVCDQVTGVRSTLRSDAIPPYLPSPDGSWLVFATFAWEYLPDSQGSIPRICFFRVSVDGSRFQQLNTRSFPFAVVGGVVERWSADGAWLEVRAWDGTEGGWYPFRLKADGSGTVERVRSGPPD